MTILYIKTHNKTGLKYFGKTTKDDVEIYKGSGLYWKRHIKKYGHDIKTEIYGIYEDDDPMLINDALSFSEKNNIVESKEWANMKYENGLDGAVKGKPKHGRDLEATLENLKKAIEHNTGRKQSKETQIKKSKSLKEYNKNLKDKSRPHFYKPVICDGIKYESAIKTAEVFEITRQTVYNRIKSEKWNWYYEQ